jgi:hypothetical protein
MSRTPGCACGTSNQPVTVILNFLNRIRRTRMQRIDSASCWKQSARFAVNFGLKDQTNNFICGIY